MTDGESGGAKSNMKLARLLPLGVVLPLCACLPAPKHGGQIDIGSSSSGGMSGTSDEDSGTSETPAGSTSGEAVTDSDADLEDQAGLLCSSACLDGETCDWGVSCGVLVRERTPDDRFIPDEASGLSDENLATVECVQAAIAADLPVTYQSQFTDETSLRTRVLWLHPDGTLVKEREDSGENCENGIYGLVFGLPRTAPSDCLADEPLEAFYCLYNLDSFASAWTCVEENDCT